MLTAPLTNACGSGLIGVVPFDPVSPRHQETGDRVLTRLSSMDSGARAFCVTAKAIRNWTVEEGLGYERVPSTAS